jgi:hypothetical protein
MARTADSKAAPSDRLVASDSRCATNFGQLRNPCARAITNCASVN